MTKRFFTNLKLVVALFFLMCGASFAQSASEMFASGGGTGSATPTQGPVTVNLVNNPNNPSGNTSVAISAPTPNVTIRVLNQQFANSATFASQGLMIGGTFPGDPHVLPMNSFFSPLSSHFTSLPIVPSGSGINVGVNHAFLLEARTLGPRLAGAARTDRLYFADLQIDFGTPVSNAVVHLAGWGGIAGGKNFSVELDFVPGSSVGASSVSLLSGNGNLSVSGNSINAATPSNGGSSGTQCTAGAACGSVRVAGDAVSRVYFRVYMESPDASLWPTNGGEGWILGVSGETSDMVPTFSSMPTAIFEGQSYTGLTLTCANEGPNFARGATCQPTVSTGTISSLVCTPSPTVDVSHVGGSNEIECTFDYLLPDGNGSSSVTFEGQTGAVNDRNGGSVGAAGNNETTEVIAASAIVANNDTPAAVNGAVETVLGNVVANDTLNSVADPAIGTDVTLNGSGTAQDGTTSLGLDVTPTAGSITLNADGSVTVAAGTTAGSYVYTYEICEVLNPSNCDTATATVEVAAAAIVANNDTPAAPVDLAQPTTGVLNVLDNDMFNDLPVDPAGITVTPVGPLPSNFVLNSDGTLDTTALVPNGTYSFDYQICEVVNPTNCNAATVQLEVISSLPLVTGNVYLDTNGNGSFEAGSDEVLEGYAVELILDGVVVQTTTSGNDGSYEFSGFAPDNGYEIVFTDVATGVAVGSISDLDIEADTVLMDQNQPIDPAGVIYNSATGAPVQGATIQMTDAAGTPLPTACLLPGQQPQTTTATGQYSFDVVPGGAPSCPTAETEYRLQITTYPSGFVTAVSALTPAEAGTLDATTCPVDAVPGGSCQLSASSTAPAAGSPTPYYLAFLLATGDPDVINNHIPLDPVPVVPVNGLSITKVANVTTARIGDVVTYTITASNGNLVAAGPLDVVDILPAGFLYTPGSATLDGAAVVPTVSGNRVTVENVTVPASGVATLTLQVRVTSAALAGDAANRARMVDPITGNALSADGVAIVRVVSEHVFDCADIIGKVFDDKNHNGYQDKGEPGLAGARVVTVRGVRITTDEFGRFHVPCAELPSDIGSNFTLKLDTASLPTGYRVTTENPRVIRVTAGKMAKLNFGASISNVVDIDLTATAFEPDTGEPIDGFGESVDRLLASIKRKPSVLRLSYLLEDEELKTAQKKLRLVEKILRAKWRRVGGYKLNIETTIKRVQ